MELKDMLAAFGGAYLERSSLSQLRLLVSFKFDGEPQLRRMRSVAVYAGVAAEVVGILGKMWRRRRR